MKDLYIEEMSQPAVEICRKSYLSLLIRILLLDILTVSLSFLLITLLIILCM